MSVKEINDIPEVDPIDAESAAAKKAANERGKVRLELPADLGARVLFRCHDEGINANEATAIYWERALRKEGSLVGEGEE